MKLEFFGENAAKWGSWWLWQTARKGGSNFLFGGYDLHRNYGLVILSFLCNYHNLTLKLHQEKCSYPNERGLFIGRFKVGSVPGKSIVLM